MSLVLPPLFHWSPLDARDRIVRRGLKPTTPTDATVSAEVIPGTSNGRWLDHEASVRCVCLGTTPSHAWSLSAAAFGDAGSVWDLWQVTLDVGDEVRPLPFFGYRLCEIRVANVIPKSRIWHVGTRTRGRRAF